MKTIIINLPFLIAVLLCGCCTADNTSGEKALLNFDIITGSGGGFTGAYSGYLIDTLGNVKTWNGMTAEQSRREDKGSLTREDIIKLNKLITESGVLEVQYSKSSNMNSFIVLKSGEKEYRFSWEGSSLKEDLPEEIKKLYTTVNEMIKNLK